MLRKLVKRHVYEYNEHKDLNFESKFIVLKSWKWPNNILEVETYEGGS